MTAISLRWLAGGIVALLAAVLFSVALAQDEAGDPPSLNQAGWQDVITRQIEAFRAGDAEAALEMAGFLFRVRYEDPDMFMQDILDWGYEPILKSRSHSFGGFQAVGAGTVLQVVQVIGPDQGYYQAVYQLGREEAGWRIQAVSLTGRQGIGI